MLVASDLRRRAAAAALAARRLARARRADPPSYGVPVLLTGGRLDRPLASELAADKRCDEHRGTHVGRWFRGARGTRAGLRRHAQRPDARGRGRRHADGRRLPVARRFSGSLAAARTRRRSRPQRLSVSARQRAPHGDVRDLRVRRALRRRRRAARARRMRSSGRVPRCAPDSRRRGHERSRDDPALHVQPRALARPRARRVFRADVRVDDVRGRARRRRVERRDGGGDRGGARTRDLRVHGRLASQRRPRARRATPASRARRANASSSSTTTSCRRPSSSRNTCVRTRPIRVRSCAVRSSTPKFRPAARARVDARELLRQFLLDVERFGAARNAAPRRQFHGVVRRIRLGGYRTRPAPAGRGRARRVQPVRGGVIITSRVRARRTSRGWCAKRARRRAPPCNCARSIRTWRVVLATGDDPLRRTAYRLLRATGASRAPRTARRRGDARSRARERGTRRGPRARARRILRRTRRRRGRAARARERRAHAPRSRRRSDLVDARNRLGAALVAAGARDDRVQHVQRRRRGAQPRRRRGARRPAGRAVPAAFGRRFRGACDIAIALAPCAPDFALVGRDARAGSRRLHVRAAVSRAALGAPVRESLGGLGSGPRALRTPAGPSRAPRGRSGARSRSRSPAAPCRCRDLVVPIADTDRAAVVARSGGRHRFSSRRALVQGRQHARERGPNDRGRYAVSGYRSS